MNKSEYDNFIERAKVLKDDINKPMSSHPYYLSIYVRETVRLIIDILEAERNER